MNNPYNIYFDNSTGRVVVNKALQSIKRNNSPQKKPPILKKDDDDFQKKIEELYKFTNINNSNNVNIEKKNPNQNVIRGRSPPRENVSQRQLQTLLQQREIESPKTVHNIIASRPVSPPKNIQIQRPIIQPNQVFQRSPSPPVQKKNQHIVGKNYFDETIDYENEKKLYDIIVNNQNDIIVNNQNDIIVNNQNDNECLEDKNKKVNNVVNVVNVVNDNKKSVKEENYYIIKKDLVYGIKKTILSDFNYLGSSSNTNDFIISLNKNINKQTSIFDSFYLFPNISEINTKTETNIINEKKVDIFKNINNNYDIQYFPIDFVACGSTIPLKSKTKSYNKLIIKNIYWNIFQSINLSNYINNELLCIVPNKYEFTYKKIELQINFELHSQVSKNVIESNNKILPYKNLNIKSITPANSCLFDITSVNINTLNGVYFDDIIINLMPELDINCALLCIRISVPDESANILKGIDKNNVVFYGNIPFSQFVLNFDYELS